MVSPDAQGLKELPYNVPSSETGSLVNKQSSLINMLLDGSWRTVRQQRGTSGDVDTPAPNETVASVATGASTTVGKIPTWALVILGVVFAAVMLKGK
jgi:hypothetical protein